MIKAVLVHLLTASGGLLGLCSVNALFHGDFYLAVPCNIATFIVDGLDGPLFLYL